MHDRRRGLTPLVFAIAATFATAANVHAFSGGITTFSFGAGGCNSCHFGGTIPTVMLTGPTTVLPSSSNEFTFQVFEVGSQTHAGLNVSALDGVLTTGGGNSANTQVLVGTGSRNEITHTGPKMAAAGVTTFSFFWTAPASFNNISLNAWGNAVNFNGTSAGDAAQFASLEVLNALGTTTPTPTPTATPLTCDAAPIAGCRTPAIGQKAFLLLKDQPDDNKDKLIWKWIKGSATAKVPDFGTPLTTTDYLLCVYDGTSTKIAEGLAPANGLCNASNPTACWSDKPTGFKYKDKDLTPHGLQQILLKEGLVEKAKIIVKGKGLNLDMPSMPVTQPLTVQLRNGAGVCWEAVYSSPAIKNEMGPPGFFKDKAD